MRGIDVGESDEELVEKFRDGDDNACTELLIRYKNLVRKKAKAMFLVGGDSDDLIQEGMIGLYHAIVHYTDDKGASFMTFASMCINRQMCTAIRLANSKKHGPLNSYVSFSTPVKSVDEAEEETVLSDVLVASGVQNPEEIVLDQDAVIELENKFIASLSDLEKMVLKLHLAGMNYTVIAKELDKTPKSIDNALQRIKAKLNQVI